MRPCRCVPLPARELGLAETHKRPDIFRGFFSALTSKSVSCMLWWVPHCQLKWLLFYWWLDSIVPKHCFFSPLPLMSVLMDACAVTNKKVSLIMGESNSVPPHIQHPTLWGEVKRSRCLPVVFLTLVMCADRREILVHTASDWLAHHQETWGVLTVSPTRSTAFRNETIFTLPVPNFSCFFLQGGL